MDPLRAVWSSLRRWFEVARSPAVWLDRILLLGWLALAVELVLHITELPPPLAFGMTVGLVATLALLSGLGIVKVVGPILFYELIRAGRQRRTFILRSAYALALLGLLVYFWLLSGEQKIRTGDPRDLAHIAAIFFRVFCIVQLFAVSFLAPATAATAITDEKERKTLEFLLATDLHNREIVFGKLSARVGRLLLFLITGLPVLGLLQFFGGIDPELLLVAFAVTGILLLSLVAVSVLVSVVLPRSREAVVVAYAVPIVYLILSWLTPPLVMLLENPNAFGRQPILHTLDDAFTAGNPTVLLGMVLGDDPYKPSELASALAGYSRFHAVAIAVCIVLSVLLVRRIALAQGTGGKAAQSRRIRNRRAVRGDAMLWKELTVEGRFRLGWFLRTLSFLAVLGSFLAIGGIVYAHWVSASSNDERPMLINYWLRTMTALIGTLGLIAVAVRGAGGITGEHEKDTLISLLTAPLLTSEIIYAKLLGSMVSVRPLAVWLGAVWVVALGFGAVDPAAILLLLVCWLPPLIFSATLGLYCSATATSTFRATLMALASGVFLFGGHVIAMGFCCIAPIAFASSGGGGEGLKYLFFFEAGLTPTAVLAWLPFRDPKDLKITDDVLLIGGALFGAVVWCVGAALLYAATQEQFDRKFHRQPFVPEKMV